MRRALAPFSKLESSNHTQSSTDFITNTSGFSFRYTQVKDRLSRANELKTAARLIVDDFFIAQLAATEFVEKKRWVPGTARNFPLDAWQKDREVLARELPLEDWNTVEIAAWAVERFRNLAPVPRSSDEMLETGQPILKDITAGIQALLPYR
jgi:hypothetical protein